MTRYIFITGGVISSVGKGIATASLAKLLTSRGLRVTVQKLDPYLNVDPGTMSPYQHGEVFVTDDGAETDLDLGHYERFLDQDLTGASSVTMGQISATVIERERKGDYLGGTIQTVPHVTDVIKERVRGLAMRANADVLIVEVGGTVGDIEGQAFLEAIRQMRYEEPPDGALAIHVTPLFHLRATDEVKTKPTQHSVRTLRSMGIQPDVILARTEVDVDEQIRAKIALFCDVPFDAVIPLRTADSIYHVPEILEDAGLTQLALERLSLTPRAGAGLDSWREWVGRLDNPQRRCRVAIVGKYIELRDSYLSVREAPDPRRRRVRRGGRDRLAAIGSAGRREPGRDRRRAGRCRGRDRARRLRRARRRGRGQRRPIRPPAAPPLPRPLPRYAEHGDRLRPLAARLGNRCHHRGR